MNISDEKQINDYKIKIVPLNNQFFVKKNNNKDIFKNYINKRKGMIAMKNLTSKYNDVIINNDSKSYHMNDNSYTNSYNLMQFNKSKILSMENSSENNNKTMIQGIKKINLKYLLNFPIKSSSTSANTKNIFSIKTPKTIKNNQLKKINSYLIKNRQSSSKNRFTFSDILRYNDFIKLEKINKATSFKNNKYESEDSLKLNLSEVTKNNFLRDKFGIYLYKNNCMNEHYSLLKKYNNKKFINDIKKKKPKKYIFSYFNKIKSNLFEENKLMEKNVRSSYSALEYKRKKINLKNININTPKEFKKIFFKFNKQRAKKNNIKTNLYINESKNPNAKTYSFEEKKDINNIINDNSITIQAINKINKLYHDLLIFKLPELDDKIYIRKILYDVFIEFKNMLLLSTMKKRDINTYKNGLDFDSFYNCNIKLNQQGKLLAKKMFKAFNNNSDNKFISFENYVNGMLKLKSPNKENKLDLFFEMLNENSKGYMSYEDIYKFGIICLQKITLNYETNDKIKDNSNNKEKKNTDIEIIKILADYFSTMIFNLVNIDIKDNIPLTSLKNIIIKGGEQADYIEFLLGFGNFV